MKNPLIIEDIEFIENNIMSIRSKVGLIFNTILMSGYLIKQSLISGHSF